MNPIPRGYLLAGLAVLVALVVANTYRLSAAVDSVRADLSECQASASRLQESIEEQNQAISGWKKQAEDAQERASAALAEAEAIERSRMQVQARLTAFQRRANESECDATRRILQEYRK